MQSLLSSGRPAVYVSAYFSVWVASLVLLRVFARFDQSEAIGAVVILGLIFPALAWFSTRRAQPISLTVRRPERETLILILYLCALGWVIVYGFESISKISAEPAHSIVLLSVKLLTFVMVPAALIAAAGSYSPAELVPLSLRLQDLRPALWMSLAALVMQGVLGRGLHDLRLAHPPAWVVLIAGPLAFVWLIIEVGVVEEFFFRVLLQERLAASLHSPWGGLIVAAVLFGLVHAPGFYLRPAATQELLGPHPSLFVAVGYSIVLTSLAGLFLGILWMRTKNFAVIVIAHAATDLLPNLLLWARSFHLLR